MAEKKKDDTGGIPLLNFALFGGDQIHELGTVSSLHIGSQMMGKVSGVVTRIELVGDLVLADVSQDFDDKNPIQFVAHISSGIARIARPGEVEQALKQAKRDRGML